eukprot:scaffold110355_cov31-Tisochrysis_lutea.AAC.6
MGHFSRFIPPGSLRTKLVDSVAVQTPPITADDVKNGPPLPASISARRGLPSLYDRAMEH